CVWLIRTFAPDARGHGTEAVIAAGHERSRRIDWLVAPQKPPAPPITARHGRAGGQGGPAAARLGAAARRVAGGGRPPPWAAWRGRPGEGGGNGGGGGALGRHRVARRAREAPGQRCHARVRRMGGKGRSVRADGGRPDEPLRGRLPPERRGPPAARDLRDQR